MFFKINNLKGKWSSQSSLHDLQDGFPL